MFLTSSDGTRIAYDVQGKGPTLLLLPGFAESRRIWYGLGYVEQLLRYFQVITMDRRGMGESDLPTEPSAYAIEKMLDDICSVADVCGAERFSIWGHSFGGSQALQLAARSNRISRAIVAGSFFGNVYPDERIRPMVAELQKVLTLQGEGQLERLGIDPEEQAWFEQRSLPAMIACWQALVSWPVVDPREVRCPLFVYAGSGDGRVAQPLLERHQEIEAAGISLRIFDNLDHEQELSQRDIVFPSAFTFLKSALVE
ncbi:MAG: alpha/beta fold hydrolase [Ktedonobacteraceae bacterium]|nr:alpha/beta fold hydrolase [Ktedonobacteraceae bacterium]